MKLVVQMYSHAIILFLLTQASNLVAAPQDSKMGYVNLEIALSQELEAQKLSKELEKEEQELNEAQTKAETEFQKKVQEFQKSVSKLSEKAKLDQETALGTEFNKLRDKFTERRMELNKKRQSKLADIENKNRLLIESISRKENYTMVFNAAVLVYVSDEIKKNDITQKLVLEYNKAYPVKVDAPAKPSVKDKLKAPVKTDAPAVKAR